MNNVLEINSLSKFYRSNWTYSKKETLKDISFNIKEGESVALLGVNGAGKTTTIKCILDLVKPSSGNITLNKQTTSYLPEQPYFYQHLSVRETLLFYGKLQNISKNNLNKKVHEVGERLGISERFKDRVKSLSKGLQQRLGIAQCLLSDPKLLILDEPFSGLDPLARIEMREIFREIKESGSSLLLCTHILSDINQLADRAIILLKGEVKKDISLSEKDLDIEEVFSQVNGVKKIKLNNINE